MFQAFTEETTIGPGGKLSIRCPELPEGARVRIVVLIEEPLPEIQPLACYVGRSRPSFRTVEEVDDFIRRERDSWD